MCAKNRSNDNLKGLRVGAEAPSACSRMSVESAPHRQEGSGPQRILASLFSFYNFSSRLPCAPQVNVVRRSSTTRGG
jgi:hypothetical protein